MSAAVAVSSVTSASAHVDLRLDLPEARDDVAVRRRGVRGVERHRAQVARGEPAGEGVERRDGSSPPPSSWQPESASDAARAGASERTASRERMASR